MGSSTSKRLKQVLEDQLLDSEFRADWEMRAPARVVANRLVKYRVDHGITQTQLGRILGVSQPAVARLETGEHLPTLTSLMRIAEALKIEILVDIRPAEAIEAWVNEETEALASASERVRRESGQELLIAAS